jgi:hypothetical protein
MNGLDKLIPFLLLSVQEISRELVGAISACMRDMTADSAAEGQVVRVPITPPAQNRDITIGTAPVATGDKFGNIDLKITKFRIGAPIIWNGEEELAVKNTLSSLKRNQFTQRMRALVNEMEEDVCFEAVTGAQGGVYGTPGTAPFTTNDMVDMSQLVKMFNDIGAPQSTRQMVVNTSAAANLRNHGVLYRVNEAGTAEMLRQGIIGRLYGFDIRESGGFRQFAATGNGYKVNGAFDVGVDAIQIDTGTGVIKKGSVFTIAGDTTKYIVTEDFAGTAGLLKLSPALKKAPATGAAITIVQDFLPSAAFTSDAVVLATRAPAMPEGGDEADDVAIITDPVTGLTFQVAYYAGYRQRRIEIGVAWGVKTVNPQHSVVLLG